MCGANGAFCMAYYAIHYGNTCLQLCAHAPPAVVVVAALFPFLQDITLDASWPSITGLTGLQSLTWETTFSPGTALDALPSLAQLSYLAINEMESPAQLEALSSALTKLHQLRHLVTTRLIDYHHPSWDPRESYAPLFEGLLSSLGTLTKLTHLTLNSNEQLGKCEAQVLSRLRPLQRLQHLGISRTKVTDVSPLSALTAITCLEALRNGFVREHLMVVLPWLQKCKVEGVHNGVDAVDADDYLGLVSSDGETDSSDMTDSSDEEGLWDGDGDGQEIIDLLGESDDEVPGLDSDDGSGLMEWDSDSDGEGWPSESEDEDPGALGGDGGDGGDEGEEGGEGEEVEGEEEAGEGEGGEEGEGEEGEEAGDGVEHE